MIAQKRKILRQIFKGCCYFGSQIPTYERNVKHVYSRMP
jgi:hypothetical protein